jgi:PAS domain S-box-containing protein
MLSALPYTLSWGSPRQELAMEQTLFQRITLTAAALTFLVIMPTDYLLHFSAGISLIEVSFGLATLLLYRESRRGRFHVMSLPLLFMVALNLAWFDSGASQGSTLFYLFAVLTYLATFTRGSIRRSLIAALIANGAVLLAAEGRFPQLVVPYLSQTHRLIDLVAAFTVSATCCTLMLWAVLGNHDRERSCLTDLNARLEKSVTEHKETERRLQEREERLSLVLRGSSDGFWDWNTLKNELTYSQRWWEMLGYSGQEMTDAPDLWYSMMHRDDLMRVAKLFSEAIDGSSESFATEFRLMHRDGYYLPIFSRAIILRDPNGKPVRVCGTNTDISRQRQLEDQLVRNQAELKLANRLLEQRVRERTADLEASLMEQQAFSYSVSHDLRAPLRHINSFSSILAEEHLDALPAEAIQYLERIAAASNRMGSLIDHLLQLSRVSMTEITLESVDLSILAAEVLTMYQETHPERKVTYSIAEDMIVWGDAALLRLLLENLLGNAWKYTAGRPDAHIEFGGAHIDGKESMFVRDNGVGFEMAYVKRLFTPFERLHGSEFEGTGIGLATAQRIIRRHGGQIWADGKTGEGATFYFTLPVYY